MPRNIDAFNAMSREGQRNALFDCFAKFSEKLFVDLYDNEIEQLVDDFLEWLYSQAE